MQRILFVIFLLLSLLVVSGSHSFVAAQEGSFPFQPGEKMNYQLRWGAFNAGQATLEVHEMKEVKGEEAYHFVMTARSSSFIDVFFKVRDRIDAYADTGMSRSLFYRKNQQEGKTRRDIKVDFDWDRNETTYVNFDTQPQVKSLMPGSFDPLSVFYYTRSLDLREGFEFQRPVTDGSRNLMGTLKVTGKKKVTVPAGTFDTLVLEPDMKNVEGVFSKKQKATIKMWVTDDERKLLVRMKSKVRVGSFVAELVSVEGHDLMKVSNLEKQQ